MDHPVSVAAREDIDRAVDLLLADLGSPEPPLKLADVTQHLKLKSCRYRFAEFQESDLSATDLIVGTTVHNTPALVHRAVTRSGLQALYLPRQREVWLDSSVPQVKHRWNEAHEIGHAIIPWHSDISLGDDAMTLTPACQAKIESEANYAAGRLIFLSDRFSAHADWNTADFGRLKKLSAQFGNSLTSTFWRYIEDVPSSVPKFGLISGHPGKSPPMSNPIRHYIASPAFKRSFRSIGASFLMAQITPTCSSAFAGLVGQGEILLLDDKADCHLFGCQTFFNQYEALTLGVYLRPYSLAINFSF